MNITISVVSHGQNALLNALLQDLSRIRAGQVSVVVTENVPDRVALQASGLPYPVETLRNLAPKGFGTNHNAAFRLCVTPYFCVLNPDVRMTENPFPTLLGSLEQDSRIAVAGPLVRAPDGSIENSARRFPTVASLAAKAFGAGRGPEYPADRGTIDVDWVAGMFMLFRSSAFRELAGFDERYFLYYEDVDLCRRLSRKGFRVRYEPGATIVHDARRTSWRNLRYLRWHLASILRFLLTR